MPSIEFTDEELAALKLEFFPRVPVTNIVASNPVVARALYKIDPSLLPWTLREEIRNEESPAQNAI